LLLRFQQIRQLGDVGCNPPRLVAREQVRRRAPAGLGLEIDVRQRLPVLASLLGWQGFGK
jgi:hypothetical protein